MSPRRMSAVELAVLGKAMFGPWGRPLGRTIGRDARAIQFRKQGERPIPEMAAAQIRALAWLGPMGRIIQNAVRSVIADADPRPAHQVARRALADLVKAGLPEEQG